MWNADIYDSFGKERMQPSIDLAARLKDKKFKRILDVGCGSGMSTAAILSTWEDAEVIGVDLSEEMLQKARKILPQVQFIRRDCSKSLADLGTFDLIFSNAFLQWIPNQEEFIARAFAMLDEGGVLAVQIPMFDEMSARRCITDAEKNWTQQLEGIEENKFITYTAAHYYDTFAEHTTKVQMWVTDYCHIMQNHEQILDFLRGAAFTPYQSRLDEEEMQVFAEEVLARIKEEYPTRKNGTVLFPFRRLFLTGQK